MWGVFQGEKTNIKGLPISRIKSKVPDTQDHSQPGLQAHLLVVFLAAPSVYISRLSVPCWVLCLECSLPPTTSWVHQRQASYLHFYIYCFFFFYHLWSLYLRHWKCSTKFYTSFQTRASSFITTLRHHPLPPLNRLIIVFPVSLVSCMHAYSSWEVPGGHVPCLIKLDIPGFYIVCCT